MAEAQMTTLYGTFQRYIYTDGEYSVIRILVDRGNYFICSPVNCGVPDNYTVGTPLLLTGYPMAQRRRYFPFDGEKGFQFYDIQTTMPRDENAAVEYIKEMKIRGILEATAKNIVKITGPNLEEYFKNGDLDELKRKARVPKESLKTLINNILSAPVHHQLYEKMSPYGISSKESLKIYKEIVKTLKHECALDEALEELGPHKTDVSGTVKRGAYYYATRLGIPFEEIDGFAQSIGYRPYHPERIRYMVLESMKMLEQRGHTWSTVETVYNVCKRMTAGTEPVAKQAIYASIRKNTESFVADNEKMYVKDTYFDEKLVVRDINRIQKHKAFLDYDPEIADIVEKEHGITFSEAQKKCFGLLRCSGIHIVTGGAGTGKSTIMSGLISAFTKLHPNKTVALCAPTGRAAQRLSELCAQYSEKVNAYTIHKLLGFKMFNGEIEPEFNDKNKLEADMIIVDEMSMIDIHIFRRLLDAIKSETVVLLCGDSNQLPSVDVGRVFWDLIDSGRFETIKLTTNYRQNGGGNVIISNADRINQGISNLVLDKTFRVQFIESDTEKQQKVLEAIHANPEATVLSPVKKGDVGTYILNKLIQPIVNKGPETDITYRTNDKVIMLRNNYDLGYFNGDVGIVDSVQYHSVKVKFGDEIIEIPRECYIDMALAYAITIHKSQGSEYDNVIIVLPNGSEHMLNRNLLYTAVTRAKKSLMIICSKGIISKAVRDKSCAERRSTLKEMLIND